MIVEAQVFESYGILIRKDARSGLYSAIIVFPEGTATPAHEISSWTTAELAMLNAKDFIIRDRHQMLNNADCLEDFIGMCEVYSLLPQDVAIPA